jgi:hypothetical protein
VVKNGTIASLLIFRFGFGLGVRGFQEGHQHRRCAFPFFLFLGQALL